MQRCEWVNLNREEDVVYHDTEWGNISLDDQHLFEMLILEGMQAGLSWITILKRRETMRVAFDNFDARKLADYDEQKIESLMQNTGVIRNRLKLQALVINANAFLELTKEQSFANYLWSFVEYHPCCQHYETMKQIPTSNDVSDRVSKDLKKRGFKFVGTTIIYAYLQAVGVIHDHTTDCFRYDSSVNEIDVRTRMKK